LKFKEEREDKRRRAQEKKNKQIIYKSSKIDDYLMPQG
jgi:hypothetical protein